jgi:3-oxoacyl-(acyl-carrier-protein) synthase
VSRPDTQRAVITGVGVVSGLGLGAEAFWAGLRAGRSCLRPWRDPDPRIAPRIGAELALFDVRERLGRHAPVVRTAGRWTGLTACAALEAARQARVDGLDPDRVGHLCAGQNLSLGYYADNVAPFREHPDDIDPLLGVVALDTDTVGAVAEIVGARGPVALIGGACASGNLAAIAALDLIRSGRADAVVVTGAPFPTHPMILHALAVIDAISHRSFHDAPGRASRPFDALREGFVPAEAAAAVVIESLACARGRGAAIRAELLGGAATSDASRQPAPHLPGQVRAIRLALSDAGVAPEDIDYVNAHATSTPLGDAVEVAALKEALGARAYRVPVNATKSMTGHGITSASVLELVATVLQIEHRTVHPTINQEVADPELDLDFVPNVARAHDIGVALSNAFGFGGINSTVVVGGAP